MPGDADLRPLIDAIASGEDQAAFDMLSADPALARAALEAGATRADAPENLLTDIGHYIYAGDTALHVAAAAHRPDIARRLIALGADLGARNRRGATPLHYAADGIPGWSGWDPQRQAAVIARLIEAGADPNAADKSGVMPLHRAVRTRCAKAVRALLDGGADPMGRNGNGSTPLMLATRQTGRGGSGSEAARAQQAEIVSMLEGLRAT
jgi:hypothetical protein